MTKLIRDDIPLGFTYDVNGKVLTYKNSNGHWYECTRDDNGNALTRKDSDGSWYEYTRDACGNELTRKDSDGRWYEYTYDDNGNELTYKDSDGYWFEYTYDTDGKILTYKSGTVFDGVLMIKISSDPNYELMVSEKGQVMAGCQRFDNVQEALEHWDRTDERAVLFTAALKEWAKDNKL